MGLRCKKCSLLINDSFVMVNNSPISVVGKFNCNSDNVIYVIKCLLCDIAYIGETKNPVRHRINQHLSSVNLNLDVPVAKHFNIEPHSITEHFRFVPICREPNDKYRKFKEAKLISKFNTSIPNGLNERTDDIRRHNTIIPLVLPYSHNNAKFGSEVVKIANRYDVTKNRIVTAFTKHKNLNVLLSNKRLNHDP